MSNHTDREAVNEWLSNNEPLALTDFEEIRSEFIREVGEMAKSKQAGYYKHVRVADASAFGEFAHQHDIAIVEEDGNPNHGQIFGLPTDDGYVPVLVAVEGNTSRAKEVMQEKYHVYRDAAPAGGEKKVMCDGGEEPDSDGPECFNCGTTEDLNRTGGVHLCDDCTTDGGDEDVGVETIEGPVLESDGKSYPHELKDTGHWGVWALSDDGEKRPRAPHRGQKLKWARWKSEYPESHMEFEKAKGYDDMLDCYDGLAYYILEEDDYVLMDFDDVRNPETDEVLPWVMELIEKTDSWAEISQSGAGIHLIVKADTPDIGEEPVIDIDGHPDAELEIYTTTRFVAVTADHVEGSGDDVEDETELLEELYEDYVDQRDEINTGTYDPSEYEPSLDKSEVEDIETTNNSEDIFDAIKHTQPRDISLRSKKTGETSNGRMDFDPSWANSKSGTRLGWDNGAFIYRKGSIKLDALQVVALEEGIITDEHDYPSGSDFFDALEALRKRGAHIPKYKADTREMSAVAILPETPNSAEWDWETAGKQDAAEAENSLQDYRERNQELINDRVEGTNPAIISSLPALGKSSGVIRAAAQTGEDMAVFAARHDIYEQYREWAEDHGLDYYTLPSMPRDCPTASGEFGEDWKDTVMDWYARGATPKAIHAHAENVIGQPLPCQENGTCPYSSKWNFEADDYDILIGHYKHSYHKEITSGRVCVFDEFPEDTFTNHLGGSTFKAAVTTYLKNEPALPFEDYADLIAMRDDEEAVRAANSFFGDEIETDPEGVMYDENAHASAPIAVYTILNADDLGNGFEHTRCPGGSRGIVDRDDLSVTMLNPPELTYTSNVLALDGTPTREMWEMVLGNHLDVVSPLTDKEREMYVANNLGISVVQTTDAIKPYSSGKYASGGAMKRDRALLREINDRYDEKPSVITTKNVESKYDDEGILDLAATSEHFGNLKGTNRMSHKRLGAIIGSRHYGDKYIKRWGAFKGISIEDNGERGEDRSYGDFGDKVLNHMREHETLQALLRFGRDGGGATVFVHTNTLPDWVPRAARGRVENVWSDGMEEVMEAVNDTYNWKTADIADKCDISRRQVLEHLKTLAERGVVEMEARVDGHRWTDSDLDAINEDGIVDLGNIDIDTLEEEITSNSQVEGNYTWNLVRLGLESPREEQSKGDAGGPDGSAVTDGGSPPPESG